MMPNSGACTTASATSSSFAGIAGCQSYAMENNYNSFTYFYSSGVCTFVTSTCDAFTADPDAVFFDLNSM